MNKKFIFSLFPGIRIHKKKRIQNKKANSCCYFFCYDFLNLWKVHFIITLNPFWVALFLRLSCLNFLCCIHISLCYINRQYSILPSARKSFVLPPAKNPGVGVDCGGGDDLMALGEGGVSGVDREGGDDLLALGESGVCCG